MNKIFIVSNQLPLKQIIQALEQLAPPSLQESYDNSGLITGNPEQMIQKAILTLDCTEAVIEEAIQVQAQLIIAHHPIIFSGLKKLNGSTYVERTVIKAIKNDIAIYALHTNLDNMLYGVNHKIADKLGLQSTRSVLKPMYNQLCKLHTYITEDKADELRNALFKAGAGQIGHYSECSFNIIGEGTFKGDGQSNPALGRPLVREHARELKIEIILPIWRKNEVLESLRKAHYYEEVAYELYPTLNAHQEVGSGLIAELHTPMKETDFLQLIRSKLHTGVIRHSGLTGKFIKRVAICGGAGIFLLSDAIRKEADVFITSDVKYHEFFDADSNILLCDIGHYESEQFTVEIFQELLNDKFPTFAALFSKTNTNPVNYY